MRSWRCLSVALLLICAGCSTEKPPALSGSADHPEPKSSKRVGPSQVATVTIGELVFAPIHWGKRRGLPQNGGYVAAFDLNSGKELWTLKIYDIQYDPEKEQDVQDIFIKIMTRSGPNLVVTDEEGRKYRVNPTTRSVRTLNTPSR